MKAPTPAELATFARAIGFELKKLGPNDDYVKRLLSCWRSWSRDITKATKEISNEERANASRRTFTLAHVRAALGGISESTTKDYFEISHAYGFHPDEIQAMWLNRKVSDAFTGDDIRVMKLEQKQRRLKSARAGGRARAVK